MKTEIDSFIVKQYGLDAGASVVGIAASKDFALAPEGFKPADSLTGCLSVVILGVPFPKEALCNTIEYTENRKKLVKKMTDMSKEVAKQINKSGHKAKAISSAGGTYVDGKQFGFISLKHAAELAGLGLINRNYLLTNPQYGNLLWFSAVLTDAELAPDAKAQYKICDNCNKCVEACPSGALDKPALFGKEECAKTSYKLAKGQFEIACFLCRTACPYCFGKA